MQFSALSKDKPVSKNNFKNTPKRKLFPEGEYDAKLASVKAITSKGGRNGISLRWTVLDPKGKDYTTVFDALWETESEWPQRKLAHFAEAISFQPENDEFEIHDMIPAAENCIDYIFAVPFKENQDSTDMEVDIFADYVYSLAGVTEEPDPAPKTKSKSKTKVKTDDTIVSEPKDSDKELVDAIGELTEAMSEETSEEF